MNNTTDCSAFFTRDTDISGIGVRVAFYLTVNLQVLQIVFAPEEYAINCWTLVTMCLGLMIATLAGISKGQISFFNAVIVANLMWLAVNAQMSIWHGFLKSVQRRTSHERLLQRIYITEAFLVGVFAVYLWANAKHFGPQAECVPEIKFYFVFIKVHLPFWLIRCVAIIWYSIFMASASYHLVCSFLVIALETTGVSPEATDPFLGRDDFSGLSPVQKALKRLRIRWQHFVQLFCIMIVWIPTLEFFLNQNPQPDDSQGEWSFGQILALISVIPCVVSVILAISKVARGEMEEECNCKASRRAAASQTGEGNPDAETEQIERMEHGDIGTGNTAALIAGE